MSDQEQTGRRGFIKTVAAGVGLQTVVAETVRAIAERAQCRYRALGETTVFLRGVDLHGNDGRVLAQEGDATCASSPSSPMGFSIGRMPRPPLA